MGFCTIAAGVLNWPSLSSTTCTSHHLLRFGKTQNPLLLSCYSLCYSMLQNLCYLSLDTYTSFSENVKDNDDKLSCKETSFPRWC
jgi:hypothetical protein